MNSSNSPNEDLQSEISDLEARLTSLKSRLAQQTSHPPSPSPPQLSTSLHPLLLLADSALPLGSFAFSSGLESYLAHQKLRNPTCTNAQQQQNFQSFLQLSLSSLAGAALPYVLAAYRYPERLRDFDNDFDASVLCNVARRASIAQGKGLLSVWERSFSGGYLGNEDAAEAVRALDAFQQQFKSSSQRQNHTRNGGQGGDEWNLPPNGHLAPLWGVVTRILGLSAQDSVYLFLFSHIRTIVSAAVRASVLGPYQAQAVLSSGRVQQLIREKMEEWWDVGWNARTEEAGQVVPVMDLWVERHEILYSRIFNS